VRLFVAVWPSSQVLRRLATLDRPEAPGLRWTTRDQWHVTLRFLGAVDVELVSEVTAALDAVAQGMKHRIVEAGPTIERLGSSVLCVPVAGLDDLARGVVEATAGFGRPPEARTFHGHLTLARAKRRLPRALTGTPFAARWRVSELTLVQSRTHPHGARYEIVHRSVLGS
jgi:2'-5' RNA ligase